MKTSIFVRTGRSVRLFKMILEFVAGVTLCVKFGVTVLRNALFCCVTKVCIKVLVVVNLLKPTGHVMHQKF